MIIHVGNRKEAETRLEKEGFRETAPFVWLSSTNLTKATLHPCPHLGEMYQIAYQQTAGITPDGRYDLLPYAA